MPLMYVLHATNFSPPLHRLPMYLVQLHQSLAPAGDSEVSGEDAKKNIMTLSALRSFTRLRDAKHFVWA